MLTLADINAELINVEPEGTGLKSKSKKEGLLRVRALSTVMVALERRALALASRVFPAIPITTAAPASPNMPPPSPFPFLSLSLLLEFSDHMWAPLIRPAKLSSQLLRSVLNPCR